MSGPHRDSTLGWQPKTTQPAESNWSIDEVRRATTYTAVARLRTLSTISLSAPSRAAHSFTAAQSIDCFRATMIA